MNEKSNQNEAISESSSNEGDKLTTIDDLLQLDLRLARGTGVKQDLTRAIQLIRASAEQGNAEAQYRLGVAFWNGEGVPLDRRDAVRWFRSAAKSGAVRAYYWLGLASITSDPQDHTEAFKWFQRSANSGDERAFFQLAMAYTLGRGVSRDLAKAFNWFQKAANAGDAAAFFRVAEAYRQRRAQGEAVSWFLRAADEGDNRGSYFLGLAHEFGDGVAQDYAEAARWYITGAEEYDHSCQLRLARLLRAGRGIPENKVDAYQWYSLAAIEIPDAAEERDELENEMTPGQIIEAQDQFEVLLERIKSGHSDPFQKSDPEISQTISPVRPSESSIYSGDDFVLRRPNLID